MRDYTDTGEFAVDHIQPSKTRVDAYAGASDLDIPDYLDESSEWSIRARAMVSSKLKFLGRHIKWAGSRVLVMQCESGLLVDGLVRRGCDVAAIDTRPDVLEFARARSASHGYRADYRHVRPSEGLPFAKESFDIVLCDHVFDRNWDTSSVITATRRMLRQNGTLMIACMNNTVGARLGVSTSMVRFAPGMPMGIKPRRPVKPWVLLNDIADGGFEVRRPGVLTALGRVHRMSSNMTSKVGPTCVWLGSATKL
ncbi:MAG: methyltransferase domain-containing protein [Pseudomonadota bacterium]